MKFFMICFSLFIALSVSQLYGQVFSDIEDIKILADKRIVLEKENPYYFDTLVVKEVVKLNNKHSKIIYQDKGTYCEAIVNSNRKEMMLVATAVEMPQNQIPKIVLDAYKRSKYSSWHIQKTLAMRTPYSPWFYALDISKEDRIKRIFFNELGAYKPPPY